MFNKMRENFYLFDEKKNASKTKFEDKSKNTRSFPIMYSSHNNVREFLNVGGENCV